MPRRHGAKVSRYDSVVDEEGVWGSYLARLTIARVRELVRRLDYAVTLHAAEELEDDEFTILDLESILLTGAIVERQRDPRSRETKCVVRGIATDGSQAEAVVKLGATGRLFVITIYRD